MSGNEPMTVASVREYMVKNDGKVRNVDLVTHFRQQLNDPVNKSKVRAEFMEIVHTIASVQTTPVGEKYFVLKRPKEGPAVMRKPARPVPITKDRPMSGPPVFRYAKMEEYASARSISVGDSGGSLEKDNRLTEKDGHLDVAHFKESTENGQHIEGDNLSTGGGSLSGTPRLLSKFLHAGTKDPDQLSQVSGGEDQEKLDEEEGDEWTGPVMHLEPLEKEWMLTSARGNRAQIMCMLEEDPNLAGKKDFMMTGLHWAAKCGRDDIVNLLAKTGIDVNAKTGYTPLHFACMYGHDDVIKILVDEYDADINARDYSGRKAKHVAKETLTIEAQQKLETLSSYSVASSESGYGGSWNSISPSVMLASSYGPNDKHYNHRNDASTEKGRDRSKSLGKLLSRKKHKHKDRPSMQHTYQGSSAAGPPEGSPLHRSLNHENFHATVVRGSFRHMSGSSLDNCRQDLHTI